MTVGQVIAKLGVDPKEYEKGLRQAERQADKAGSKIGSIFKNAFSVTLGMGMFEALKRGIKSTVGAAVDFNSMLQTAKIGFTTMLGSAERAQTFLDDMAKFAARTPFEYPELLDASKKMLAYGFAAENVLPTLKAVGDAAAALGAGSEGIDRITLALGQIQAKGKLSGEEMRQLTEAGIPAWHMLAEAMGTTVPALQDMVSKGLVPGGKAVEMLTAGMTKRFGGMMSSMEDTWQGVTSSIKDIWRMTVGTLTQTLFGGLNNMLIKLRDFLQQFYDMLQAVMGKKAKQSTVGLTKSTQEQAEAITEVGDAAETAAKKAKRNLQAFDEINTLAKQSAESTEGMGIGIPASVGPIDLGQASGWKVDIDVDTSKMEAGLGRIKNLLKEIYEEWGIKDFFKGFKDGLKSINFEGIKNSFITTFTNLGEIAQTAGMQLQPIFQDLGASLGTMLKFGIAIAGNLFEPIALGWANFTENMKGPIQNWIVETSNTITNGLSNLNTIYEVMGNSWLQSIEKYKPVIAQSMEDTLTNVSNTFMFMGTIAADTFEIITGKISEFTTNNKDEIQKFTDSISQIFTDAWGFINKIWEDYLGGLRTFWDNWGKGIVDTLMGFVMDIYGWLLYLWNDLVKPVWDKMMYWLNKIWDEKLKSIIDNGLAFAGKLWELISWVWNKVLKPLVDRLLKFFVPNIKRVFEFVVDIIGIAFDTIAGIIDGIIKVFNGIVDFIIGIFTGDWERAWEGVKGIFKGIWDTFESIAKAPLNAVIALVNAMIDMLNNVKIKLPKIPDWVPVIGGKGGNELGFDLKKLDYLGQGDPKSVGRRSSDVGIYTPANSDKSSTGNIGIKAPKGKRQQKRSGLNDMLKIDCFLKESMSRYIKTEGIARPGNVVKLQGNTESWEHPAMYRYVKANDPTLAIIGDNRYEGEIVAPESKIYEQVTKALRDSGGFGDNNRPILLTVQLGNTEIYRELVKGMREYERQTGIPLFAGI